MPPVNAGGFQCLFGETVGVNVQHGIDRVRPSGPGTVRAWNAQPYKRNCGVRGSPASGDCGCEAQVGPWAYSNYCRLFSGPDVYLCTELSICTRFWEQEKAAPISEHSSEVRMLVNQGRMEVVIM